MKNKQNIKVLINTASFYPAVCYGGPIFSLLNLSKSLKDLGANVKIVTTNVNCTEKLKVDTNRFINVEGIQVKYYNLTISYRYSFSLTQLLFIWKDIKDCDISYINSIFTFPTLFGLFNSRVLKKFTILSPRGSLASWALENGSKFKKIWLRLFIKPYANYVVWHATSNQEKNEILALFPNAKVKIIPNGINLEEFSKLNYLDKESYIAKFTDIKVDKVDKIIVSMGRLQRKKGFNILIDAFSKILHDYPNSFLLIAGTDEGAKDSLKKQIKELNLQNKVFLIGNIKNQNKIDFLANADLFVLPSYNENFGNVYLESLAAGTPIVASKYTPWEEVENYECGKWVENSVEDTVNAMLEMLSKDREALREKCLKLSRKYDWSNIAKEFIKICNFREE